MDNFTPLIVIPVVLVILFMFRRRRAMAGNKTKTNMPLQDAIAIVDELEALGYYKYADLKDIPTLKQDLINGGFTGSRALAMRYSSSHFLPLDSRLYFLDGEDLFDEGGFTNAIKDMQALFDKIDLKMDITDHVEKVDADDLLNHSITINGKRYIIFQHFNDYGPKEAVQRYAEIINDLLALQNKDERLYLIGVGHQGRAIFLTEQQFTLIDSLLHDEEWKPLKVKDWCRVFKVDPTKYLGKKY